MLPAAAPLRFSFSFAFAFSAGCGPPGGPSERTRSGGGAAARSPFRVPRDSWRWWWWLWGESERARVALGARRGTRAREGGRGSGAQPPRRRETPAGEGTRKERGRKQALRAHAARQGPTTPPPPPPPSLRVRAPARARARGGARGPAEYAQAGARGGKEKSAPAMRPSSQAVLVAAQEAPPAAGAVARPLPPLPAPLEDAFAPCTPPRLSFLGRACLHDTPPLRPVVGGSDRARANELPDARRRGYVCNGCRTFAMHADDVVSTAFHGRRGGAILCRKLHNVRPGNREDRMLMSGLHTVCDVHCARCDEVIGWRYDHAHHPAQKYKVGKFVVERACIMPYVED